MFEEEAINLTKVANEAARMLDDEEAILSAAAQIQIYHPQVTNAARSLAAQPRFAWE